MGTAGLKKKELPGHEPVGSVVTQVLVARVFSNIRLVTGDPFVSSAMIKKVTFASFLHV